MQKNLLIYLILILLASILIFFNYFEITGLVSRDQGGLIVSLDIPSDQQKIKPGESILLEVVIRELGGTTEETTAIDLEYSIKDLDGNIISSKQERGAIAVKQSEVTSLLIPTNTKPGVYVASVSVNYKGNTYIGTKTFEIITTEKTSSLNLNIIVTIILVIITIFIITILILIRKRKGSLRKPRKYKRHKRR